MTGLHACTGSLTGNRPTEEHHVLQHLETQGIRALGFFVYDVVFKTLTCTLSP